MTTHRPTGLYTYAVDRGDGRWLLEKDGQTQRSTPGTQLAFAFDRECGTLHKHGEPSMVKRWLEDTKEKLKSNSDLDLSLDLLIVESYPVVGDPRPGINYLSEADANAIISTGGYILRVLAKLDAIDVEAFEAPSQSPG